MADELGLAEPALGWHTIRLRPARLQCGAGIRARGDGQDRAATSSCSRRPRSPRRRRAGAKVAEAPRRCPTSATPSAPSRVVACAQRAPGLVATILAAMVQEHERAAGAWQAEWEPLLELLRLAGSAAATASRSCSTGLDVDAERMRADLDATGELVMSESVAAALSDVDRAARGPAAGRPRPPRVGRARAARFARCCWTLPEVRGRPGRRRARRGARSARLPRA